MSVGKHVQHDAPDVTGDQRRLPAAARRADELMNRAEETRHPFDPELTLFVDESPRSHRAEELLRAAGQQFRVLPATGRHIPALVFGGVVVEHLEGIQRAMTALSIFDDRLRASVNADRLRERVPFAQDSEEALQEASTARQH